MNRRKITIIALVYAGYVLLATLYPFEFSGDSREPFKETFFGFFAEWERRDLILNILLFIPLGALLYGRFRLARTKSSAVLLATLFAAVTSLLIEILQVFVLRHSSASDVLSNTLGAAAGAIIVALWPRLGELGYHLWAQLEKSGIALGLAVLLGAVPLILSVVQFSGPFAIWNSGFSFQIGNEPTLDRPWLGRVYFVGLYNRALTAEEIQGNYERGTAPRSLKSPMGLISAYTFSEGKGDIIYDRSGFEAPLDLRISPKDRVRWLDPNGIEILRPAILRSAAAGTKLVEAFSETHEFSIEMWIKPRSTLQDGPARIVSFSDDSSGRNFTLGQIGSNIEFRIRTPITGRNGTPLALRTTNGFLTSGMVHIIATYHRGIQKVYANGVEQPKRLNLTADGIIGFGTSKTLGAQIAYAWFYFFPVSFVLSGFAPRGLRDSIIASIVPGGVAAGMLAITEIFQAYAFERTLDFRVMGCGLLVAGLGAFSRSMFRPVNGPPFPPKS